ncbi:hypothetical protein ACQPXH_04470 [Nocardia sp. CA-135953]|uniref:hypothetical protein n=1 Tax=Nocardia sp. CA-135953 TaxID=3239978 RepID=UPI003D986CF3
MFASYVVLLAISGIVLVTLALIAHELPMRHRVFNGLAGAVFFGYAGYLAFGLHGGTYRMFWAAFILPVFMLVNFVRTIDLSDVEGPQRVRRMPPPELQPQRTQATRERHAARREAERAAIRARHTGSPE